MYDFGPFKIELTGIKFTDLLSAFAALVALALSVLSLRQQSKLQQEQLKSDRLQLRLDTLIRITFYLEGEPNLPQALIEMNESLPPEALQRSSQYRADITALKCLFPKEVIDAHADLHRSYVALRKEEIALRKTGLMLEQRIEKTRPLVVKTVQCEEQLMETASPLLVFYPLTRIEKLAARAKDTGRLIRNKLGSFRAIPKV